MKIETLKKRLRHERPQQEITLQMPQDVVEDLQRIAPLLGFSNFRALLRAYIGQGLRHDLERIDGNDAVMALVASLKRHGVGDRQIADALKEIGRQ